MPDSIETVIEEARRQRTEGNAHEAEQGYRRAAELARSDGNECLLAHALRHISDLERERGEPREAWENATEAVRIYRSSDDRLGLANAIRLQALSAEDQREAAACWREAREIYSDLGVSAGVAECDRRLNDG
jgi:tetratricopeptide (TPR) repeat protein